MRRMISVNSTSPLDCALRERRNAEMDAELLHEWEEPDA